MHGRWVARRRGFYYKCVRRLLVVEEAALTLEWLWTLNVGGDEEGEGEGERGGGERGGDKERGRG